MEEVNLILSLPAGLIQASERRGVEISTGQSSLLPGKFPLMEALKDPVRALDPLPRGALTVCPITPCPPWAVDLNLVLVSSEPDWCHQAGHLQLTTDGCCVPKTRLSSSLAQSPKLQELWTMMIKNQVQATWPGVQGLPPFALNVSPGSAFYLLLVHSWRPHLQPHLSPYISVGSRASLLGPGLSPALPVQSQTISSNQVGKWKEKVIKPCVRPHFLLKCPCVFFCKETKWQCG